MHERERGGGGLGRFGRLCSACARSHDVLLRGGQQRCALNGGLALLGPLDILEVILVVLRIGDVLILVPRVEVAPLQNLAMREKKQHKKETGSV